MADWAADSPPHPSGKSFSSPGRDRAMSPITNLTHALSNASLRTPSPTSSRPSLFECEEANRDPPTFRSLPRPVPRGGRSSGSSSPYRFNAIPAPSPLQLLQQERTWGEATSLKRPHAAVCDDPPLSPPEKPALLNCKLTDSGNGYTITHDTMASILNGTLAVSNYVVLDCRYSFEFNGGHIEGAINTPDDKVVKEVFNKKLPANTVFIFHCEFSSKRGPARLRAFRDLDRRANTWPNVSYREVYLLDKGYCAFYKHHSELCEPRDYIPMRHHAHQEEVKKENKKGRRRFQVDEIRRTQSCSGFELFKDDEIDVEDDQAFRSHNSNFRELSRSSHNLFKSSKTEHSSPTGSFVSCYSPPKLSTMGHDRKRLYRRNLFSASSPELFNSLAQRESASGGRTSPRPPFLQVVGPASTSPSSSSSPSPPSFFTFASSSTPLLQPKEKRFLFLTPPTSSETSPATSPPLSPRTRELARTETGFSIRRSVSTSDVRIDPSRASKRLKLSPIPLPKQFDL